MNNDRTQPTSGAVFAINMLVGTEAGDSIAFLLILDEIQKVENWSESIKRELL
jgi:hypothetical protein